MERPCQDRRARRRHSLHGMVPLLVLALIVGPAPADGALLLHEHDADGHHGHQLPAGAPTKGSSSLAAWHDGQHGHAGPEDAPGDAPASGPTLDEVPTGTILDTPASPLPRPDRAARTALGDLLEAGAASPLALVKPEDHGVTPPAGPDSTPRAPPGSLSGAVRVLRSSRALRI